MKIFPCSMGRRLAAAMLALLLVGCGGSQSAAPNANAGQKIRLVYLAKGMQDVYWKSVELGLRQAEKEARAEGQNVDVTWDAPTTDGDRPAQMAMVENYANQQPAGIILCPIDDNALVAPAARAHRAGIPLIIVDSPLNYAETVAFIGTDNHRGGLVAGEELARLLGGKGSVILMRFNPGSASCAAREQGFLDAMKQHPNIKLLSTETYAGNSREKALDTALNLLSTYGGQVEGVFTPNESSTNGMLLALEKTQQAGKVKFVGFDGGTANMAGLKAGEIDALVLQNPYQMGYLGVKTMLDHLAGKTVPKDIDTGAILLTKANLDSAPVKELLSHTVQ